MGKIENRLAELGYELPAVMVSKLTYVNAVRTGNFVYTAGHIPVSATGELITGKRVALALLATLKNELGELDHIKRVAKRTGFINCVDTFTDQASVINGASDTVVDIFGNKGKHARSGLGINALPFNAAVEIEAIVEIDEDTPVVL
ncbi:hypothetical protein Pcac1_g27205 [Phytophthora cactorum]|uniref:Uncharacterized protein n=1 Tax=Phytophthora cactorum TaxID=29920 RepID=A0A8T1B458_9STRA|nr:hypothetical protein Pcac1_g27205 [Phytophthora cactorum]KAG2885335.1 hypothetical protein PC114_g19728 [Phytophthora cactorum]KAG2896127.1 hypothetical protein PC115_g17598 [Phytophthora cactorum]KAG3059779.1 hypothetical protein PC122_g20184 [Phytophthora cactorum]KAG3134597.1 hypothetical protein C6341_g22095 [Phytophthora cactorum]